VRNAVSHSGARGVVISLAEEDGGARLVVKDDGSGIADLSLERKGMGLHIMRHRAGIIGASFDIESNSHGTVVSCRVMSETEKKES
jgi:signal transduction histidine kinase